MPALLDPLAPEQQRVVEIIAEVFLEHGRWPIFDYIERKLDAEQIDANRVLAAFPTSDPLFGGGPYSAIWRLSHGGEQPVGLTVVGLDHSELVQRRFSRAIESAFFSLVRYFIRLYRAEPPSPFAITYVDAPGDAITHVLAKEGVGELIDLNLVFDLLKHEPATWYGNPSSGPAGTPAWRITRQILTFDEIETVESYVERFVEVANPPSSPPPAVTSPLGLPAAIDYLDAIWRLVPSHDHKSLMRLHGAERTATLMLPANSADEFHARLSALADILTGLRIDPAAGVKSVRGKSATLSRLHSHLQAIVPEDGHEHVARAIERLQDIILLRHGGSHGSASTRAQAAAAYMRLAIAYPPTDWPRAWQQIQVSAIEALSAIRDELAPLTRPDS